MAYTSRKNITTAITQDLISAGDNVFPTSINIANVSASNNVNVDLFINNCDNNYYIIKNHQVDVGNRIIIDMTKIEFKSTNTTDDSLRIKLDSATPVDVLIK